MSLLYDFNQSADVEKVTMKWPCDEYIIPAGTPMSRTGIANDENAIGILAAEARVEFSYPLSIAPHIGKKEPKGNKDYTFFIITGGFVNLKDAEASYGEKISDAAKEAMTGIKFVDEDEPSSFGGGDAVLDENGKLLNEVLPDGYPYEEEITTRVLKGEGDCSFDGSSVFADISDSLMSALVRNSGSDVVVVIDGVDYYTKVVYDSAGGGFDAQLSGDYVKIGCMATMDSGSLKAATVPEAKTVTVQIYTEEPQTVVQTIDPKFLPPDIGGGSPQLIISFDVVGTEATYAINMTYEEILNHLKNNTNIDGAMVGYTEQNAQLAKLCSISWTSWTGGDIELTFIVYSDGFRAISFNLASDNTLTRPVVVD